MNNNFYHLGRFANDFIVGAAMHFIAIKNNLKVSYKNYDNFKKLGIELFLGGKTYNDAIMLSDDNFFNFITGEPIYKNIIILNNVWCQTKEFAFYMKDFIYEINQKNKIINNNLFMKRYNNNNDVYVHIRLGDIAHTNRIHPFKYYDKALSNINFTDGYISSDSIDHDTCKKLINKYNLKTINTDVVETIMFASTCKNVVLSSGTFSWMIGLLSFYSNVYYPKIYVPWHGDIFVFPEWKEIEY